MSNTPERDPVAELLAPPGPVNADSLRQALLVETTRRLRRSRRLRFAAVAAALVACYVAGLGTMYLLRPSAAPAAIVPDDRQPQPAPERVAKAPTPPAVGPQPADPPQSAAVLRQQGDRYLNEENDPESALQSYTKALNTGTDDDAKFSPDDNWLLMAIKNAREKEAQNAKTD